MFNPSSSPSEQGTRDFLDPKVLAALGGMPLLARRPMRGNVSGIHTSPTRGSSVEFAEYRKYVPGDDLRRLDWRAHGRSDRYYVKEYEADTNLRCCIVVDTSGSMDYGTVPKKGSKKSSDSGPSTKLRVPRPGVTLSKLEYAKQIAATIAYLAAQQGDAVGLSCVADGIVHHLPPRRNPAHLRVMFDTLNEATPQGETDLVSVLHQLAETTAQAALVIVISDFFVDSSELLGCFEHLRFRRHDLSLFHLLDPMELDFAFSGPTRFLDMEGGTAMLAEPSEIAHQYRKAMTEYLKDLDRIVTRSGSDYHRVTIDESVQNVLTNFVTRRATSRGVR